MQANRGQARMLKTGEAGSIRDSYALRLWSAKQVRSRAAYRVWYVKHVLRGEPELRLVPALCHPNRLMLDVGANRGMYAAAALRFSGGVMAFEPQPHLAALMRKCLPATIKIAECAVSDSEGTAELLVPRDPRRHPEARIADGDNPAGGDANRWAKTSISTVSLDKAVTGPVGLIKVDVEGHEMAVLEGGAGIFARWRPNVIIELEDRHRSGAVDRAQAWFAAIRYEPFTLEGGRLVRVRQDVARADAASSGNVYNFIFLPIERSETPRPSLRAALSSVLAL